MIAICPNPFRDTGLEISKQARALLARENIPSVICPIFAESDPQALPAGVETVSLDQTAMDCSLAIAIGGDGTILSVARKVHRLAIPIIGVNLGTKGFMSALEPEELPLIVKAARNEMKISRRMMLDVKLIREGALIYSDCALNDVVLHGYGDCVKLTAFCQGDRITSYSGDGIIISTPTGSTGYSMSAGGPIVEPDAANIIISPICAHMMGSRSFVLNPGRRISVMAEKLHGRRAYLSVDGVFAMDLSNGDTVTVEKSEHYTLMADLGLRSFYEIAYGKLT